ncbi:Cys-tRNA(Pro) deacylase [Fredinandcohnia sp. QZ13]|uniref:Cys-tRNA(Pro) deacylase n=1 Tax=Fredinandcohnia sp. QZ13 TaxID=3073144 RepID=UPI00285338D1|nr:Cys-tRNA(Pro) deacylase [Fredinandcohnia sp. QZ13]MDR4886233.1 Cys-tRNA(Pro) deacylase [Fredinandcohnia sp. QZ13]
MAKGKTNAMRILDSRKIEYKIHTYESNDGKIDGVSVAQKIGLDTKKVYKTLVAQGNNKDIFVFVIPVEEELDLKKAAIVANVKKVEMVPVKDIQKHTGYIRGGCSPIGMKKAYPTFIDAQASNLDSIIVSAGKIGMQVELTVADLTSSTEGQIVDIIK